MESAGVFDVDATEAQDSTKMMNPLVELEDASTVHAGGNHGATSPGRVVKYSGDPLRRFRVKQYHLDDAPKEIELCVEEWQMVLVDQDLHVLQTIRLRDIVCWSGSDEQLNLLLATFERVSLKVRLDDSMSKDSDKVSSTQILDRGLFLFRRQ